jgi:hypothetical protein
MRLARALARQVGRRFGRQTWCLHVLSSFQRTGPRSQAPPLCETRQPEQGIQANTTPLGPRSQTGIFDRVQGNLPTLLLLPRAVNISLRPDRLLRSAKPPPGQMLEDLPLWCPTWEPGKPGTWGHPPLPNGKQRFDERRKRISILRAGGGPVNPSLSLIESNFTALSGDLDPGARHATTASHTEGQWLQTPLDYDLGTWMSTGRHYASRRQ